VRKFGRIRQSAAALTISWRRASIALIAVPAVSLAAGFAAARSAHAPSDVQTPWQHLTGFSARLLSFAPPPTDNQPEAAAVDLDDVTALVPQSQAERLLDRAMHGSESSLAQIGARADAWRGHIAETSNLFDLVRRALASDDLRLRSAAVEVDLAANGLSKSTQSVDRLQLQLRLHPESRTWTLWRLGALGNRGVEAGTVLATLIRYARDPQETTRYWAVEGLAALGTDASIRPLLDVLRTDASPKVRRSAALNLAQSGMLTPQQRLSVVPELLNFLDDDSLDTTTRGLVYATLRGITGEALGNDANAWRKWWATHDAPAPRKRSTLPHLLRA